MKRIEVKCPKGNAPTCFVCGNWNAMLDGHEWSKKADKMICWIQCRDCGARLYAHEFVVVKIEADKPGMGAATTYHEVGRSNGENWC